MKINEHTKKSNKKWLIIVPVVLIVLAGGAFAAYKFLYKNNDQSSDIRPVNTVDYNPPTEQQTQSSTESKKEALEKTDPEVVPENTDVSILISRAGQSAPGTPIAVRTIISGVSTGSCTMTFTKGSNSFSQTFEIKYEATTYTCNGDVPSSNFNENGDWTLSVSVNQASAKLEGAVHVQK